MNDIGEIKNVLRQLGITPNKKGYHYAVKGVMLAKREFERGKLVRNFLEVYNAIGDAFDTKGYCVERCLRSVISDAEKENTEVFKQLFGNIKNITVSGFISIIAEHVSQNNL